MIYDNTKTDLFYNFTTDGDPFDFCGKRKIDTMEARKIMLATKEKCDAVLKVLEQVEAEAMQKNQSMIMHGYCVNREKEIFEKCGFNVLLKIDENAEKGKQEYIQIIKGNNVFIFRSLFHLEQAADILKLVQGGLNART